MVAKAAIRGLTAALAVLICLASVVRAVPAGSAEANSALSFDPFNPSVTAAAKVAASGASVAAAKVIAVPSQLSVTSSALTVNRTPGDPPTVCVSVSNAPTVLQSATVNTTAVFTVSLSAPALFQITVNYTTADGPAPEGVGGGGVAGDDYTAKTGTLTFAPGQTSIPVPVTVLPEKGESFFESFYLNISGTEGRE